MAALPLRKPDPYEYEDDEDPEELPTNQLTSGRLASRPLHPVPATGDEEPSNVIDWVSRISNTQSASLHRQRNTISLLPPPTGMYQHSTPARMVPARGSRLGAALRNVTLYLLLPVLVIGGAAWAVVATVGTAWITDIFAPPPPAQTTTEPEPLDAGFGPGPVAPIAPELPPLDGTAEELRQRGISLLAEKNYSEAIRYLETAANIGTDDALAYYHLGLAYLAVTGRPHSVDDAELAFRTAASLQPNWAPAHRMLAESLVRGGFYEEAIGPALEATRLDPSLSEAWLTLSSAYKGAGRDAEATQAYAEATRHSPAPPMSP